MNGPVPLRTRGYAMVITARAPVRNADLGGWRDTRLFKSGKVMIG